MIVIHLPPSGSDTTVNSWDANGVLASFCATPAKPQTLSQPSASADTRHDPRLAPAPSKNTDPAAKLRAVKLADDTPAEEHVGALGALHHRVGGLGAGRRADRGGCGDLRRGGRTGRDLRPRPTSPGPVHCPSHRHQHP